MSNGSGSWYKYSFEKLVIVVIIYLVMVFGLILLFPGTFQELSATVFSPTETPFTAASAGEKSAAEERAETTLSAEEATATDAPAGETPVQAEENNTSTSGEAATQQFTATFTVTTVPPTATMTATITPTAPPGGTLVVVTLRGVNLSELKGYDGGGNPVIVEASPAVFVAGGSFLTVAWQPVTASDGQLYYRIEGDLYKGLYVRATDVEVYQ